MEKVTLNVQGMSCEHCVKAIKGSVGELTGVKNVDVHLSEGKVEVEFDPSNVTLDKVKEAIEDQGYEVA